MALVVKDRVRESSTTTGTGTITLSGAYLGFQTFSAAVSDGSTLFYAIHNTSPGVETEWEVGFGTYSAGTLTRDTLYSSSTGSAVNFSAGTKEVFITYPAEAAVFEDNSGNVTIEGKLTVGAEPTADLDVATKGYVDNSVAAALLYHDAVRLKPVGNLASTYDNGSSGVGATLTNNTTQAALTVDGVAVDNDDRILVSEQAAGAQNGVYVVTDKGSASTNWILTRSTDTNSYAPSSPTALSRGDAFFIRLGDTDAGQAYVCTVVGEITFGTTAITFSLFSATPQYTGTGNINVAGQVISLTGTIDETNGGTGISSFTAGEILYASGTTTLAQLAGNTTTTVKYLTQTGTGAASAAPTWTALAASATTDTTNASNISSGTLPSARVSGSYTGITGVGTLTAGTWNASVIGAAYGGTGLSSYTVGDIVYATGTTTIGKLADIAAGNVLLSGGVGVEPQYGKVALTTHVSGVLPVANGGTGQTTASGAINALTPSQTGNGGNYLTTNGSVVSWAAVPSPNNGTLTMAVSGTGLSGSASFTADQAGASSFTVTSNATSANTASAIVARDGSGNFSAGTVTAALTGNASTATTLQTARTIGGVSFNGSANINLPGVNATGNQNTSGSSASTTGNASTATTLQTARTIGGVSFNGSANINLPGVNSAGNQNTSGAAATLQTARTIGGVSFNGSANINLPGVNATGNQNTSGSSASTTGNAATATVLQTARTIGGVSFNGSANINLPGVNSAGNQNTTGNAATATTFTGDQTNWASNRTNAVANMLGWKNYGNGHIIFDASQSTSPTGSAVNNTNSVAAWSSTYPTLMGWNGGQTYGVRVDSARVADNAATATTATTANALNTGNNYQVNSLGVGTAASGTAGEIRATNNVTAYYSDDRLKTKLGDIDNALDKIDTLAGFYYEANQTAQDLGYAVIREVGVSAQSVQAIMPEVVAPAPIDDRYLTVRYERLVPLLIQGIKELRAEIKALKGQ